ncbi:Transcriptional regulator [Sandaracinus amylolyticus]|uniref:Transcriptional regulator n=1 Tax=Sandaracinus amylolyticus TaxID=927083 RepID=A0A0F6YL79_9BACT|nr:Transcriptional regulator [Sandaracinus amylolyticus]
MFLRVAPGLEHAELFRESFACIVRKGHPRVGRALTLERFLELDHVLVSAPDYGPGVVEFELAKRSLRRRVAVRVPSFLVAPALVARTDMICTVPRGIAELAARAHPLRVVSPPIELPSFAVQMIWRAGAGSDVALRWLRAHLVAAATRVG